MLANSQSTSRIAEGSHNLGSNPTPELTDEKQRTLVRKVSKVSILQTARKVERDRVLTEQKLIPLTQHSKVPVIETSQLPSSQFASKVFRDNPMPDNPGPGTYSLLQQNNSEARKAKWLQSVSVEGQAKRIGFGSQADRDTNPVLRNQMEVNSTRTKGATSSKGHKSLFKVEAYERDLSQAP